MILSVLIGGRKRLDAPFRPECLDATGQALRDTLPALRKLGPVTVYVTDDMGVSHVIATRAAEQDSVVHEDDDFTVTWSGQEFIAVYRDADPDAFGGIDFGFHRADVLLAIADLVRRYPREA